MHELPVEILVIIFKEVMRQATCSADRYTSIFHLMLVCRRCRDIIVRNLTFWSHITASDEESIPFALKSINHSDSGPLSVGLVWYSSATTERMVVPLSKLADQSHQLTGFSIVSPSIHTLPQWASPVANLHTLAIRNKGVQQPLVDFFGGPLPQLHHLALEGFCSWPTGLFCNLHYITLQLPSTSGKASFTGILDLLAASPGLRTLNICSRIGTSHLYRPSRVITLPCLTSLSIFKSSPRDILSHVSLPSDVEVRLIECTNIVGDLRSDSLSGPGDPALSCLTRLFTLRVVLDIEHSTLNLVAFKHKRSIPTLVIKNKVIPQSNNAVVQSLEDYATIPAFALVETLFVVTDTPLQISWNWWLSSFHLLHQIMVRTHDNAAMHSMLQRELGYDPVLYLLPKQTPTRDPRGMESLHIDWRATACRMRYHCVFGDVPHTEHRRTAGLVTQMKPRRVAVSRRGRK